MNIYEHADTINYILAGENQNSDQVINQYCNEHDLDPEKFILDVDYDGSIVANVN